MTDSDKPTGQRVQQEPSDKLCGCYRDWLCAVLLTVFNAKGNPAVFKRVDATVCNRHPVGVACHIFKHLLGLFDRIAYIDNPVFGIQLVFELVKWSLSNWSQVCKMAIKPSLPLSSFWPKLRRVLEAAANRQLSISFLLFRMMVLSSWGRVKTTWK